MLNWDLGNFDIKMNCKKILTKKKTHALYHSNPLFGVCHIFLLLVIYIEVWSRLEAFWRTSKKDGKKPSEQKLNDFFVVFVATDLHPDTIFFFGIVLPNNKIKINNYPLSLKVSKRLCSYQTSYKFQLSPYKILTRAGV